MALSRAPGAGAQPGAEARPEPDGRGAGGRGRRLAALAWRFETWLCLAGLPPLVFRERFGPGLQALALLWLALLWLARRLASGQWTRRTVLDAPSLALLATLPGAIAVAQLPAAGLSRALSLLAGMALAYALANFVHGPRRAWLVATWLLLAGLALVPLSLVSVEWIDKFAPLAAALRGLPRFIGAVPHPTLPDYGPAGGVGVHPNSVAGLLTLFLPLAVALRFGAGSSRRAAAAAAPGDAALAPPPWIRPLAGISLLACGGLLLLTQSRGAWLATGLALLLMALARQRWAFVLAGGGLTAALAALALGPTAFLARLEAFGIPTGPLAGRIALWREAAGLLEGHALTGIGLNTFLVVHGQRPEYDGGFVYQGFPHAHNVLLQAALDYGLPGLVAVVGLYAALAWAAWRLHRRLAGTPMAALAQGLGFGLLAHALHGLVDAVAIGSKIGFVPWAFAGALAGLRAEAHRLRPRGRHSDLPRG